MYIEIKNNKFYSIIKYCEEQNLVIKFQKLNILKIKTNK